MSVPKVVVFKGFFFGNWSLFFTRLIKGIEFRTYGFQSGNFVRVRSEI